MNTEWVAPTIAGVFLLISGVVAAVMARRGQKLGNRETRAPDVENLWAQQEADRRMRQVAEDLWWKLWRAFQSYYRRVMALAIKWGLTPEQIAMLELNASEQRAIDARPPEDN